MLNWNILASLLFSNYFKNETRVIHWCILTITKCNIFPSKLMKKICTDKFVSTKVTWSSAMFSLTSSIKNATFPGICKAIKTSIDFCFKKIKCVVFPTHFFSVIICCVFRPANGCSARLSLVKINFLMLKQLFAYF